MNKRKLKIIITSLIIVGVIITVFAVNANEEISNPKISDLMNVETENHYSSYNNNHGNIIPIDETHVISISDLSFIGEEFTSTDEEIYEWISDSSISFDIDINEKGYYYIYFDYFSLVKSHISIGLSVSINGVVPYYEASQISLDTLWEEAGDGGVDRYGNDVNVLQKVYDKWQYKVLTDAGKLYTKGLGFYLESGINNIDISKISGELRLREVSLKGESEIISYDKYVSKYENVSLNVMKEFEAEEVSYKNSSTIIRGTNKEVGVTPFSKNKNKLNVLGIDSYNLPGDSVTWKVDVEKAGYYYLTFKVKQSKQKTTSYRTLYVNGEIPFKEAEHLPFSFSKSWNNVSLSSLEGKPFLIYLSPGDEISLAVDSSLFVNISEKLRLLANEMTNLGLDITKLTRNNVDKNIDWEMLEYFPDLEILLDKWTVEMEEIIDKLQSLYGFKNDAQIIQDIRAAKYKIDELASDLNEIPRRLTLLSTGASSAVQLLSAQIDLVLQQPVIVDKFYIHTDLKNLPSPNGNFFEKTWISIARFFLSFTDGSYNENADPDELEIWVNRSRQYVDILQKISDDVFTKEYGIKVKVSLMTDDSKLLLANSANQEPDIALGVSAWIPNEYGMRGMLYDFRQREGYQDLLKVYNPEQLIPMTYDNKLYGLPETENFFVLYYRKDILEKFDLAVPNTWDDVLDMLPVLDRYGMSFYVPLSSSDAFKSFIMTMPFIHQFNGKVYAEDGLSAAVDDEGTINALTFMTDLYREYSLPQQVPSFFNSFRYGTIPLGIADFGTYLQLINTASEIKGLWDIALVPGVAYEVNGETVINRSITAAERAAIIFEKSDKKEEAWKYLQWWMSTEAQSLYSEVLVNSLGSKYLWNSANLEAFALNSWDESHKEVILNQWHHLKENPKIPGSYIIEREISNIFNNVIYEDANLRSAVSDSILKMNKEIKRKMEEFKYIDSSGNVIKPFIIPKVSDIERWLQDE
jgi:ABC-type glycerol-3-phosphate transport system substrate-binding protein